MGRGAGSVDPGGAEGHPGRRLATLLGSVALIVLLVVLGVIVAVNSGGDDHPTATAPTGTSVAGAPAPPAGQSSTALAAAPKSRWELYQGLAAPYSAEHGPKSVQGLGVASGYTHDPAGALLAATQIATRLTLAPDGVWRSIVAAQVMPGEGRTTYTTARSKAHIAANTVPSNSLNQIAGFRVVNYTDTVAVLDIAVRTKTGSVQAAQTTVVWDGGDWKLVLHPNGAAGTAAIPLPGLSGYTLWSGV